VTEPGSGRAATAAPSYEEYYGFARAPFTLAPDPQFLYLSEPHREALEALRDAIASRHGFAVLTGEVGTGKTTIARALLTTLDRTAFASLILNPFLTIDELVREMLLDFGVLSGEDVRSGRAVAATREDLMRTLREFLAAIGSIGGHGVLILDEAQHLPPAVLEQVRLIGSADDSSSRPLQVVLLGRPALLDLLADPALQSFDSRISYKRHLTPLSRRALEGYVTHRLRVAGSAAAVHFNGDALDEVHGLSRGVPRLVNLLCDRALMLCARDRVHAVGPDAVRRAGVALDLSAAEPVVHVPRRRWRTWLTAALALNLVAAAVLALVPPADWVNAPLPELPGAPHAAQAPAAEAYPVPATLEFVPVPELAPPASPVSRAS
jgi:general secretion pathway protein A